MTPLLEVLPDPRWPDAVRTTLRRQSDEYFRMYFEGRVPRADEKDVFIEEAVVQMTPVRAFQNNCYRVEIGRTPTPYTHLRIRRLDGGRCFEWADMQRIKNEIVGPDYEAVQLFPAESRLVNTANEYHLWVHPDDHFRFPIGWTNRAVLAEPIEICGAQQSAAALQDSRPKGTQISAGALILTPAQQKVGSLVRLASAKRG